MWLSSWFPCFSMACQEILQIYVWAHGSNFRSTEIPVLMSWHVQNNWDVCESLLSPQQNLSKTIAVIRHLRYIFQFEDFYFFFFTWRLFCWCLMVRYMYVPLDYVQENPWMWGVLAGLIFCCLCDSFQKSPVHIGQHLEFTWMQILWLWMMSYC